MIWLLLLAGWLVAAGFIVAGLRGAMREFAEQDDSTDNDERYEPWRQR